MMRLQRFLAQAGLASRRKAEELIVAGRVRVNGKVVRELGTSVDPHADRVTCDNRRVVPQDHVWLLLNKPDATVCTANDPQGRPTAIDLLGPQPTRVFSVGRLDYHTQGALLLTNDGDLAGALTHPRNRVPRVYHVKVKGLTAVTALEPLREGVTLDDGVTVSAQARLLGDTGTHTWIEMTLHQGVNRQIHRMLETLGLRVLRLIRVSFGGLDLEGLRPGEYRPLTQRELDALRKLVQLGGETQRQDARRTGRRQRPRKRAGQRAETKAPPTRPAAKKPAATKAPPKKQPAAKKAPPKKQPATKKQPAPRKEPVPKKQPAPKKAPPKKPAAKKPAPKMSPARQGRRAGKATSPRAPSKRGRGRR